MTDTTVGLLLVAALSAFMLITVAGRFPKERTFGQAVSYLLWRWARFWWALADGVEHGCERYRETSARIEVPELRRDDVDGDRLAGDAR